eukprot:GDKJ01013706.1.p1 GENE.GDKJ01013706.1~~GDKJ01013706.1.p1  ORF type:complete len:121 (-),score=21.83 GDKJ01013706.1:64-426(-)
MDVEKNINFRENTEEEHYDKITSGNTPHSRSVDGWVLIVRNINEEVIDEDILDLFEECGPVRNIHMNLDRRSGVTKGYALIEYELESEAESAIKNYDGHELAGQKLKVDWAFQSPPKNFD